MSSHSATLPIVSLRRRTTDREEVQAIAKRIMERRREPAPPRSDPPHPLPAKAPR